MATILTIASKKGGVGKTATAISLAHGLALKGYTVLVVDTDPQGHVATALGLEQEPGLFNLLMAGRPLREVVCEARPSLRVLPGNQRTSTAEAMLVYEKATYQVLARAITGSTNGKLDYTINDTAPSGVGFLQESALWAAHLVLIPSAVDYLSGIGLVDLVGKLAEFQGKGWRGAILGVLPTFQHEVTKESRANLEELRQAFGEAMYPASWPAWQCAPGLSRPRNASPSGAAHVHNALTASLESASGVGAGMAADVAVWSLALVTGVDA